MATQVSLTQQAGGDLDLLDALRGRGNRIKTQQEMLREQSMSPVEIGSYNGIQGNFPVSQGFNKIAQGLLATYMDSQARDKAQAAADAQKDEAQKYAAGFAGTPAVAGVDALPPERGTVPGPVVDGVVPETVDAANFRFAMDKLRREQPGQAGDDYRANAPVFGMPGQRLEALPGQGAADNLGAPGRDAVAPQAAIELTQAQRAARILQGMGSTNSLVNRMAIHLSDQDAKAELARQHNEQMGSNAALLAQSRGAAADAAAQLKTQSQLDRQATNDQKIATDKQTRYEKLADAAIPKMNVSNSGFQAAINEHDAILALLDKIKTFPGLETSGITPGQVGGVVGMLPPLSEQARNFDALMKQLLASGKFANLQTLKSTGATLGAVSNAEGKSLQEAFAALDPKMNPKDFRAELTRLAEKTLTQRNHLTDAHAASNAEFGRVIKRAYSDYDLPVTAPRIEAPPAPPPPGPAPPAPAQRVIQYDVNGKRVAQ